MPPPRPQLSLAAVKATKNPTDRLLRAHRLLAFVATELTRRVLHPEASLLDRLDVLQQRHGPLPNRAAIDDACALYEARLEARKNIDIEQTAQAADQLIDAADALLKLLPTKIARIIRHTPLPPPRPYVRALKYLAVAVLLGAMVGVDGFLAAVDDVVVFTRALTTYVQEQLAGTPQDPEQARRRRACIDGGGRWELHESGHYWCKMF